MFLTLLKRAVKSALHQAVEEWSLECGLSRTVVEEMRAHRQALAAQAEADAARADARAALALNVADEDEMRPTVLLMPSAARITTADIREGCLPPLEDQEESPSSLNTQEDAALQQDSKDACPPSGDEILLLQWVHRQRDQEIGWADIAQQAASAGHTLSEDALRMRHRRWLEKNNPPSDDQPPAA